MQESEQKVTKVVVLETRDGKSISVSVYLNITFDMSNLIE